jgi:ABC-type glycerol-3-phosphate transport system substrate-binding protein
MDGVVAAAISAGWSILGVCNDDSSLTAAGRERSRRALRIWAHHGQEAEKAAVRGIVAAYECAMGTEAGPVELSFFPDQQYTERLSIAAAAGDMPDVFEVDGPLVARFVDAGLVAPLDHLFSARDLDDFLPSVRIQGSVRGHLYALGAFDSAAALYFDRRALEEASVRLPPAATGLSWPELLDACERLKSAGHLPLSLHMNESADEWFTYAFSPLIWSGGGRLIDAEGASVRGVLASQANVRSMRAWQGLFERGFASHSSVDPNPFGNGTAAMDWSGHWMARAHLASKGQALGAMALPRLGEAPVSPCGSYCWAISSGSELLESADSWLRWVTAPSTGVLPLVRANGAVPARRSAFAALPEYGSVPYSLFREQLERSARPRPRTPFYATLTREFAAALRDIARGARPEPRLRRAEDAVQAVIDRRLGSLRGRRR